MSNAGSGGFVFWRGDWWKVLAEEPRDMYYLRAEDGRTTRVSMRVLLHTDNSA